MGLPGIYSAAPGRPLLVRHVISRRFRGVGLSRCREAADVVRSQVPQKIMHITKLVYLPAVSRRQSQIRKVVREDEDMRRIHEERPRLAVHGRLDEPVLDVLQGREEVPLALGVARHPRQVDQVGTAGAAVADCRLELGGRAHGNLGRQPLPAEILDQLGLSRVPVLVPDPADGPVVRGTVDPVQDCALPVQWTLHALEIPALISLALGRRVIRRVIPWTGDPSLDLGAVEVEGVDLTPVVGDRPKAEVLDEVRPKPSLGEVAEDRLLSLALLEVHLALVVHAPCLLPLLQLEDKLRHVGPLLQELLHKFRSWKVVRGTCASCSCSVPCEAPVQESAGATTVFFLRAGHRVLNRCRVVRFE